ncbi:MULTISPECIES: glycosyltransferase family 2 protein [unclassified Vibrio]|uniref:glycosyltransferase family 2 protein n=1 Tax=unclassified Vibrio TaxID=2614977 RepID=UPI001A8DAE2E|nr:MULTISPECIES: glycosyltransferase family 2 protein [unclassified Vibrio]MBO0136461.1 glycosyltransferase family 2 protein [Vibrio sp. Vb2736]MDW3051476.1 glycosyltransferase family 2 protein [Vibrio sp. 1408]
MKKVSIIIPTYNNNNKLERLLNTIPKLSLFEIIVVDDHADFYSNALTTKYKDVIFLRNSNGKGAGGARNTGLAYATGDYVLFADSDDIFTDDFYDIVSKYLDYDFDVIYFSPSSFKEDAEYTPGIRHLRYSKLVDEFVLRGSDNIRYYFYVPWSKLINRKFLSINKIQFEEIISSNDLIFSTKVGLFSENVLAVNEVIYSVEEGSNSMTRRLTTESLSCRLEAMFRFNQLLDDSGMINKKKSMAPWILRLITKSPVLALKYLFLGFKSNTPLFLISKR